MKRSVLFTLIIAIIAAAVLGGYLTNKDAAVSEFNQKDLFSLNGNQMDLNKVTRIAVYGADNALLADAKKVLQHWQLPQHNDYLADETALSELLGAIKSSQIIETKTKLKKNHVRLGLTDIQNVNSKAQLLVISEGQKTFSVLLGKKATNGIGQFVRLQGEDQTYLIDRQITLPEASSQWIDSEIVNLEYDKVRSVKVKKAGEDTYQLLRLSQTQSDSKEPQALPLTAKNNAGLAPHFEFADADNGQELMYPGILDGLVRNILGMSAEDVFQTAQFEQQEQYITLEIASENSDKSLLYKKLNVVSLVGREGYFVNDKSGLFWLKISEFDFSQINKSKDEFYESDAE